MKYSGLGIMALLGIYACAPSPIQTGVEASFSFKLLRHYSWLPTPGKMGPGLPLCNPALDQSIRHEMEDVLASKGYQSVPLADAEWMVEYQVFAADPKNKDMTHAVVGSLMINVTSGVPSQLIWQAMVQTPIDLSLPPADQARLLHTAVVEVLRRFPSS